VERLSKHDCGLNGGSGAALASRVGIQAAPGALLPSIKPRLTDPDRRAGTYHPATRLKLANAGKDTRSIQGYLGHKDIRHTVRYTELSPTRFKNFWPD
jgi:hypothetical protein